MTHASSADPSFPDRQKPEARTPADLASAVESLRLSIRNTMEKGQGQEMASDAGMRPEQVSRQLTAAPPEGQGLQVIVLLAAINRDMRRGDAYRIEAWKRLVFGDVTEIHEEEVSVVRFPKDGRQFRLEGL